MDFEAHDLEGDSHAADGTARRGFPAPPASADAASDPAGEPGVAGPAAFRRNAPAATTLKRLAHRCRNFRANSPLYT